MALTAVQIASQALVRLGALPISDFAEPTLEARTAAARRLANSSGPSVASQGRAPSARDRIRHRVLASEYGNSGIAVHCAGTISPDRPILFRMGKGVP